MPRETGSWQLPERNSDSPADPAAHRHRLRQQQRKIFWQTFFLWSRGEGSVRTNCRSAMPIHRIGRPCIPATNASGGKQGIELTERIVQYPRQNSAANKLDYRAYSTFRVSRKTVTLISPGYVKVCSIAPAISRLILAAWRSFTREESTMMRISRPAWTANA